MIRRPASLNLIQQKIVDTLKAGGLTQRLALYWLAVSMYETGNFSSQLFKLANNCFGMKVPTLRPSTKNGTFTVGNIQYSSYETIEDSARDLVLYMQEFNYPTDFTTIQMLVQFMKSKGYFEQTFNLYLAGVKAKLNSIL